MSVNLTLLRHGESRHNAEGDCLSGLADTRMTELGRKQCHKLAALLTQRPIDRLFVSPLQRARETAQLVFPSRKGQVLDFLSEIDYGVYDGKDPDTLDDTDPVIHAWNQAPGTLIFPGGDSIASHAQRTRAGFQDLARQMDNVCREIVCVSHKTTIRLFLADSLGLDLNHFRSIPCENCSLSEIAWVDGIFHVGAINVTATSLRSIKGD